MAKKSTEGVPHDPRREWLLLPLRSFLEVVCRPYSVKCRILDDTFEFLINGASVISLIVDRVSEDQVPPVLKTLKVHLIQELRKSHIQVLQAPFRGVGQLNSLYPDQHAKLFGKWIFENSQWLLSRGFNEGNSRLIPNETIDKVYERFLYDLGHIKSEWLHKDFPK